MTALVERLRDMAAFMALEPSWSSPSRGAIIGPQYVEWMRQAADEIEALRQPGAEYRRGVEAGRTAARDLRNAMHRSLRSGHKQAHMNYGPLTVCLDAIDRALSDSIPDTKGGRDG